jgi:tetratricopeptide (TPR) repeat protein
LVDLIKGKYRIVREIARSNDIVYEAQDTVLGRRIALKELNIAPNLTGQPRRERIERFNREARAAGRLSHPNIVSIYDFGEENGRHFIAMEFLEGQTLRDIMQVRGALPLKEAINIACMILEALAYAHANRVIHRDIKPDNIHILPGGQVKLADFGIARLTEEPSLTSDGQVFGTPSYMSPEQIEGRGIDYRSDLFSLGVLLYEMLTGRKPFVGDSVIAITYAVMNADPPPMAGVPTGVEQVIRRALGKSPAQRQASADQMRQDLRNAEQVPPLFFPPAPAAGHTSQTHMGQTGMGSYPGGMPYPPTGAPMGAAGYGGNAGQGANVGNGGNAAYGMGVPGAYAPMPQAAPPPQNTGPQAGGLPWTWNMPGSNSIPAQGMGGQQPMQQAGANSGPLTSASGIYPYASPPYPASPQQPLIVLSPAARTTLLSILGAVIFGTLLAFGVVAVQRKYQDFQTNAVAQQVASLIAQANVAYNGKDYAKAAQLLENALQANPNDKQRTMIQTELGYTYVLLARDAKKSNDLAQARADYEKAIKYSPDYDVAHTELSVLLEGMGDHQGAQDQRDQVQSSSVNESVPARLDSNTQSTVVSPSGGGASGPSQDTQQFVANRDAQAQQLLQEGDALSAQGNRDGAEEKWRKAVEMGAGTEISTLARQRIDGGQSSPRFN